PPLLTTGKAIAIAGAKRSPLGTIRRSNGARQVTFAGHPLYLFSGGAKRGQVNGEGLRDFGAGWYALSPTGHKIDNDCRRQPSRRPIPRGTAAHRQRSLFA